MVTDETEAGSQAELLRYRAEWQKYGASSIRYWLPFISFLPGVLLFGWLLSFLVNDGLAHGLVAGVWAIWWIVAGRDYCRFRCPRCGEKFFVRKGFPTFSTNLTNKCLNCGLPKYARDSTGAKPEEAF